MPPGDLIDAARVARFRGDLAALTDAPPSPAARLGIAVSGGSDSLALLLLAHAAWPDGIAAVTIDHGLRAEAAAEAEAVAASCATLAIPHATLHVEGPTPSSGNLQAWARTQRYRLIADWAARARIGQVATAHHRDDVAETFLMRAARGAGVRSLAAMPAIRTLAASPVLLVRPLLGWSRTDLAAIVRDAGLHAVDDPSNADPRFDRARVRRLLAVTPDLPPDRLAHTAANLRDVEEAMEWLVLRVRDRLEEDADRVRLCAGDLPFELQRRLVARAIETVRQRRGIFAPWRETEIPSLVRALATGGGGTVADVVGTARGADWYFRTAPPRRSPESAPTGPK